MTPSKEQNSTPQNARFRQAEQMINKAIANMGDETHIEYGSTMERKDKPSIWKKWLRRMRLARN